MKRKFIVLLGDLISSKAIKKREAVQKLLMGACIKSRSIFGKDMYAPIKITRGDEISAVLKSATNLYRVADNILEGIYPYRMRFIFVRGILTTSLRTKDPTLIDGPAFHLANEYLRKAKKEKNEFIFSFGDSLFDNILNLLTNLTIGLKQNWTLRQRKVVKLYQILGNQKKVAKKLGVSQQSIAKILKSSSWKRIEEAEDTINSILSFLNREYNQK